MDIQDGALITAAGQVELTDGRILVYPGPNVVSFNLIEARTHQKRADRIRRALFSQLRTQPDGITRVTDMSGLFDFLSSATSSVLMSFAALEGLSNVLADQLQDGSTITVERKGIPVVYDKDEVPRRLAIAEKLHLVAPLVTGRPSAKGTAIWEKFVHLRKLRDELVHIKKFGYAGEPTHPQAYGRLLRGDGNSAVQDAAQIVHAVAPEWMPETLRKRLVT